MIYRSFDNIVHVHRWLLQFLHHKHFVNTLPVPVFLFDVWKLMVWSSLQLLSLLLTKHCVTLLNSDEKMMTVIVFMKCANMHFRPYLCTLFNLKFPLGFFFTVYWSSLETISYIQYILYHSCSYTMLTDWNTQTQYAMFLWLHHFIKRKCIFGIFGDQDAIY